MYIIRLHINDVLYSSTMSQNQLEKEACASGRDIRHNKHVLLSPDVTRELPSLTLLHARKSNLSAVKTLGNPTSWSE